MDGPPYDWQEGPEIIDSIRRYRWLVVCITLLGAIAAFTWSSRQPVRYEGVVRLYLNPTGDDDGRAVRSQAEFITSPEVLDRTVALDGNRLSRKELTQRLTIEPARDTDVITIKVLDATRAQAGALAESVARAYRESISRQATEAARQAVAAANQRQQQLDREIRSLDQQLARNPDDQRLVANRKAKDDQLADLAKEAEMARLQASRAAGRAETVRESATVPDEPAQPKSRRNAAIGALLGLVVAAGLAWWLNARRLRNLQLLDSLHARGADRGEARSQVTAKGALAPAGGFRRDSRQITVNGSPAGNGSASGIADFDQVATSIQQLFRSLDGPPRKLYEKDLPHMVVEQITQSFPVDLAVILLKTDEGVRIMGSVGPETVSDDALDQAAWDLIDDAASSGPRLVYLDELQSLAGTGLEAEEDVSLALVPLVRDQVGFGVLLTGRRQNDDGDAAQLGDEEVEQIAGAVYDMVPYLWAWLLLRSLKARLGTFH